MASKPTSLRDLALKARAYRMISILFVLVGLFLFAYLYQTKIHGHFDRLFKDPFLLTIFILPFLPAFFLSLLARRFEKKFDEALRAPPKK